MKSIGIDIGTTTISGVVYDSERDEIVESSTVANDYFIHRENDWERIQDAGGIVKKASRVLDSLLDAHGPVSSIGLTGQMHGIVYTDKDGKAVSPLFTWQDGRGNLKAGGNESLAVFLREKYRKNVSSGYGLVTHLWNVKNGVVPENAAAIATIGDYLGMYLTGRKAPLMHISNAASLGFFDAGRKCFDEGILTEQGADIGILPEITGDFSELGKYRGIPVIAAIGDNQASFLGSAGLKEGSVLLNMGTGGQISLLSDRIFESGGIESRPITGDKYLLVGASLCGGRAFAIVERFFREFVKAAGGNDEPQFKTLSALAEKGAEGDRSLKISTLFMGSREEPSLRGSVENISEDNFTPEAFAYGVFEGMARELYDMYSIIKKGTGIRADRLIASGNALRMNPALQNIFSEMFDAPLQLSRYKEEAAAGAAIGSISVKG